MYLIGQNKPSIKLLQRAKVIIDVSAKWYELGIALLEERKLGQLEIIMANKNSNVTACCYAMFNYWIKTQPEASWHQLVEALREPGVELHNVAATVKEIFIGLCIGIHICVI